MYDIFLKEEHNCHLLQNSSSLNTSVRYRYKCLAYVSLFRIQDHPRQSIACSCKGGENERDRLYRKYVSIFNVSYKYVIVDKRVLTASHVKWHERIRASRHATMIRRFVARMTFSWRISFYYIDAIVITTQYYAKLQGIR